MLLSPSALIPKPIAQVRTVGWFTAGYLLIAALFAQETRNWEFVLYIGVVCMAIYVTLIAHRRVGFSRGLLWLLSLWGLLHMIGGLMPIPATWPSDGGKAVFYSLWIIPRFLKYDHIVHAYGVAVATIVVWQCVHSISTERLPTIGVLTLCVLTGIGLGALNEMVEFFATLLITSTNVGGYVNTGLDLLSNFIGALLAALWIRRRGFDPMPAPVLPPKFLMRKTARRVKRLLEERRQMKAGRAEK